MFAFHLGKSLVLISTVDFGGIKVVGSAVLGLYFQEDESIPALIGQFYGLPKEKRSIVAKLY